MVLPERSGGRECPGPLPALPARSGVPSPPRRGQNQSLCRGHWLVWGVTSVLDFACFFLFQLDIVEFIPSLLYFGYTALMVLSFWLLTGTIGFYAAYMFVRKIYAAVKID